MIQSITISKQKNKYIPITFDIPTSGRTSVGVFNSQDVLIRTIWNGYSQNAGKHGIVWDGKLDDGVTNATSGVYTIKALSNNVQYEWQGVLANTSTVTGTNILRSIHFAQSLICFLGDIYIACGYGEGDPPLIKISSFNRGAKTNALPYISSTSTEGINVICSDDTYIYAAGFDPYTSPVKHYCFAIKINDGTFKTFTNGQSYTTVASRTYSSIFGIVNDDLGNQTDIAVQKFSNLIAVAHNKLNRVAIYNKTTGVLLANNTISNPQGLCFDSNGMLWISTGTTVIQCVVDGTSGIIASPTITLSGLSYPKAVDLSYDNLSIIVCDAGTSQQIKAFSAQTGTLQWTFGQSGGYGVSPTVANDKFYFSDINDGLNSTSISFDNDGSFWVLDFGNSRILHFDSNRNYLETIMWIEGFYSSSIDKNNSTRLFANYMEFQVDYTSAINQSWVLKNNWGYNLTNTQKQVGEALSYIATLSNGKTYTIVGDTSTGLYIGEFSSTGIIYGPQIDNNFYQRLNYGMDKDGSIYRIENYTGDFKYYKRTITGFSSGWPVYSSEVLIANITGFGIGDPILQGARTNIGATTTNNILVCLAANAASSNDYHLGGVIIGDNKWLWKTARTMSGGTSYNGAFPTDGRFDAGNGSTYQASIAMALDRNIIWGYNGELYKGKGCNKYNHFYDNGLFLGQFGVVNSVVGATAGNPMVENNAIAPSLTKVGTDYYLHHNGEGYQGGIHRWKISGLDTILEQIITIVI